MKRLDEPYFYITGHLGRDPERKVTATGKTLAKSSIAYNNTEDQVVWIDLVWWDSSAEQAISTLHKGQGIRLVGRYEAKAYNEKVYHTITVSMWDAIPMKLKENGGTRSNQSQQASEPLEDIPF